MKRVFKAMAVCVLLVSLMLVAGCVQGSTNEPAQVETQPQEVTQAVTQAVSFDGMTLNLYVAAGMKKPMDRIIQTFQEETGAEVAVNYGPTGGLYAQIEQNQPCDLYYAADWLYIEKLQEINKVEKENKFLTDSLVLVTSKTGADKVKSLSDLGNDGVVVALADSQAPVGVYSKNALVSLKLWDAVSANIKAMPSTVNQVALMVIEDQVDAGLIYSSVATGNELEAVEVIDQKDSGEIIFGTAVIKGGQTALAEAFATHAANNISVFEEYGWKAYE